MGKRFQIITNTEGRIKVYHCQWLWGDYAIRRLGTAVRNFMLYNKDSYRPFEDFLKGSFYGKFNDMNSFDRYLNYDADCFDDNKWIVGKKKFAYLDKFLEKLDNNDEYFYIEFEEAGINHNEKKGIKGYCFMQDRDNLKPISAIDYMKANKEHDDFTKKQKKEYQDGLKTFEKLRLIEPIRRVKT